MASSFWRGVFKILLVLALASIISVSDRTESYGAEKAQISERVAMLSVEEASKVFSPCSRMGPRGKASFSVPTVSEVMLAELELVQFTQSRFKRSINDFYRQYVAIDVNGTRALYINVFHTHGFSIDKLAPKWRVEFVDICDGSSAFWGVIFHIDKKTFSDLQTNPGPTRNK